MSTARTGRSIWFLCPVYLDVESFQALRRDLLHTLLDSRELHGWSVHFVAVDDTGGVDPDIPRLRGLPDVMVVEPPFNLGHQRAIVYGLRMVADQICDDDIVVTLDADGEDRPADLPRLLAPLLAASASATSIALARRTWRHESMRFKIMYAAFRVIFRLLTGVAIRTGNYAAYRGWTAKRLLRHPHFDLCYSSTFISLNVAIDYVPCPRGHRYAGQSRMNYSRLILHGMRMLMPFTDRLALRALVLFSAAFTGGALMALVVVATRVLTTIAVPGWATSAVLLILTLSFVALGNFVILFALFAQSSSISLANLEDAGNRSTRRPSPPSD